MNGKENPIELLVMSVVMIVLGVAGVIAGLSRGLLGSLDGLLMLSIALMVALIFTGLLFVLAKGQGWIGKHSKEGSSPAAGK